MELVKQLTIAVLTNEENFEEAKSAGADIIGNDD
jgi:ribosomal protein L1